MFILVFLDVLDVLVKFQIIDVIKDIVILIWILLEKDGGSFVFNYVIEYKLVRVFKWILVSYNIIVVNTIFIVKDLTEGMEYEFRVLVENKVGFSKLFVFFFVIVREFVSKQYQLLIILNFDCCSVRVVLFDGFFLIVDCLFVGGEVFFVLEGFFDISVFLGEDVIMEC